MGVATEEAMGRRVPVEHGDVDRDREVDASLVTSGGAARATARLCYLGSA